MSQNIEIVLTTIRLSHKRLIIVKMVGTKSRSKYKRKRTTFTGVQKQKMQRFDDEMIRPSRPTDVELEDEAQQPESVNNLLADKDTTGNPPVSEKDGQETTANTPRSRSQKKLESRIINSQQLEMGNRKLTGYRLIDMEQLQDALNSAHKCKGGRLMLSEDYDKRCGLQSSLHFKCSNCKKKTTFSTSKSVATKRGRSFDVNRRAVLSALHQGVGFTGLESFCAMLNLPCLDKKSYYKQMNSIVCTIKKAADTEMSSAGKRLRQMLEKDEFMTEGSLLDIAVSFDGTWAKRGHSSLFGVVFVISVDSGEASDFHVLSKFCKSCSIWENKKGNEPTKYEEWKARHESVCTANFRGSSQAMEMEGALIMWRRSVEKHNMRYKFMVSDGDSKSFDAVSASQVYGEDFVMEKIDCVGHVQKRMGKRLLNLKARNKEKLADGKTLGGRGRLTEAVIKKIQRYYGLAIRQNAVKNAAPTDHEKNVAQYQMKKNIIAILHHVIKRTDATKQHFYCPRGSESWCAWQRDVANRTKSYKDTHCLPEVFFEVLKPIFLDLSSDRLLARCTLGATQNPNECINSLVWTRCSKHKFHGLPAIAFAASAAVLHFNGGYTSLIEFQKDLGTPASEKSIETYTRRDIARIEKSKKAADDKEKKKRAARNQQKIAREEALKEAEGQTYESGAF